MSATADVAVVGLGGMGSAAAAQLARRGLRVVGFEQYPLAHDLGSSHGDSRVIREAYFEHPDYVPLLQRSYQLWFDTQDESGVELITLTGGYMIGRPGDDVVEGSIRSARLHGLDHEVLAGSEVRRRHPQLAVPDDHLALWEARSGFVRPEASARVHAALAERAGAELHFDTPVQRWDIGRTGVTIETSAGSWSADRLVVAAGPWAGRLLAGCGFPLVVERVVMFWFEPDDRERFVVGRFPIHVWDDPARLRLYGFPAHGDPHDGVKVAFFRGGGNCDPDTVDREVAATEIDAMRDHLKSRVPGLAGRCVDAKVCLYTTTPDEHFVLGAHPHTERVIVAAGFSGHGFKFVPVVGEVCADLVVDGRTDHPIGFLAPARFG